MVADIHDRHREHIKDQPIRYLTDDEGQKVLNELDPSAAADPAHKKGRRAARDIFILMVDTGFQINYESTLSTEVVVDR